MDKAIYTINGINYVKDGWLGCQLKSFEFGVNPGDTRVIVDQLMFAWAVKNRGILEWIFLLRMRPEVSWCLVGINGKTLDEANTRIATLYANLPK